MRVMEEELVNAFHLFDMTGKSRVDIKVTHPGFRYHPDNLDARDVDAVLGLQIL